MLSPVESNPEVSFCSQKLMGGFDKAVYCALSSFFCLFPAMGLTWDSSSQVPLYCIVVIRLPSVSPFDI